MGGSSDTREAGAAGRASADGELWAAVVEDLNHPGEAIDTTLRRLAQRAARVTESSSVIFLLTPRGNLRPAAFWDDDAGRLADLGALFSRGPASGKVGLTGTVIQEDRPVLVSGPSDLSAADQASPYADFADDSGLDSFLLVPMRGAGGPVGVLGVGRYNPDRKVDSSVIPTAEAFASLAAQVVRVASLVQRGKVADLALGAMRDAVVAVDEAGVVTFWNRGADHLYGVPESEAVGRPFVAMVHSEVLDESDGIFDPNRLEWELPGGTAWMGRLAQNRTDRSRLVVESVISPIRDIRGVQRGAVIVNRDISGMIEIGTALRKKELLAQTALDASPLIMGVFDSDGTLLACSRGWRELAGPDRVLGATVRSFASDVLTTPQDERRLLESFTRVLGGAAHDHNDFDVESGDRRRTLAVWISQVHGVGVTITISDVSDRARRERELAYSATHDSVTGLPNRGVLLTRAVNALHRASRKEAPVGLLFCDLDGFKELNDTHGHGAGDDLLAAFAARLLDSCRASDAVARVGGDEFAVLLDDDVTEESLAAVAERVVASCGSPFDIPAGTVSVTVSVGAVLAQPRPGSSHTDAEVDDLLEKADMAMYRAKSLGKNRWSRYSDDLLRSRSLRSRTGKELTAAVREGQFTLHYQPQFGRSGELTGAEALLRWRHPERGLVETRELIADLGGVPKDAAESVQEQLVHDLAGWLPQVPPGFRLTVNLSQEQWSQRPAMDALVEALGAAGVPLSLLRLEVEPEAMVADLDYSAGMTRRLADAGVEIAISGIDLGQSGMLGLRRLSLGCVVLGGRIVRDGQKDGGALIRALVAMSRQLGWRVLATGVETDEQLEVVRAAGCSAAQGYLLGHPVPAAEFAAEQLASGTVSLRR